MSTSPTPVQTVPISINLSGGTLTEVMTVLQDALNVLTVIPATAVGAGLANVILGIITAAVQRIQSQTGKPIDLTQIPVEQPLP